MRHLLLSSLVAMFLVGCSENRMSSGGDPLPRATVGSLDFDPYGSSRQPDETQLYRDDHVPQAGDRAFLEE